MMTHWIHAALPLAALLCFSLPSCASPQDSNEDKQAAPAARSPSANDTRQPSADTGSMLRRFVAECKTINPGSAGFPSVSVIGEKQPEEHELPRREIRISQPFRICRYETTQELYQAIMKTNPSRWPGKRNSVERVTIANARDFCEKLTIRLRADDLIANTETVRLPTDVEWEYCCRAGTETRYSFGDSVSRNGATDQLDKVAWHTGNAAGNDPAVGVLEPNPWQLFDMHGYLWEYVEAPESDAKDRVTIRGGSWRDRHPFLSSASYLTIPVSDSGDHIGFRCVIAEKAAAKKATNR